VVNESWFLFLLGGRWLIAKWVYGIEFDLNGEVDQFKA